MLIAINAPVTIFSCKVIVEMFGRALKTLYTLIFFFGSCCEAIKRWTVEPGFLDAKAWKDEHAPCGLDKIVFPEQYSSVIFCPSYFSTQGIIFPREGALLMEMDSEIVFNKDEKFSENCKSYSHFVEMKQPPVRYWFDPANWNDSIDKSDNPAVPHIEQIPCSNEEVVMAHTGPLSVSLDEAEHLYMQTFTLGEQELSSDHLKRLLKTDFGQIMFKDSDDTKVQYFDEPICGCHRPDAFLELQWLVCKYTTRTCEIPKCLNPITVTGHCCAVCGIELKVQVIDCLNPKWKSLAKRVRQAAEFRGDLDFHTGMVDTGKEKFLQIIVLDKDDYTEKSVDFMRYLNNTLLKDYGNDKLSFQSSGVPYNPGDTISSWVIIFATLVPVVTFFAILYAYYVPENPYVSIPPWLYPNRYRIFSSPFVFARFENTQVERERQEGGNVVMNITYEDEENAHFESGATSFNNPMFTPTDKNIEKGEDVVAMEPVLECIGAEIEDK